MPLTRRSTISLEELETHSHSGASTSDGSLECQNCQQLKLLEEGARHSEEHRRLGLPQCDSVQSSDAQLPSRHILA